MLKLANIFWLGLKEIRSVFSDTVMLVIIVWAFTLAIYNQAIGIGETINNASIAFVDEDNSTLSAKMQEVFYPPYFKRAERLNPSEVDAAMDNNQYMFVVTIPPDFEADVRRGKSPEFQIDIDATAVLQAGIGANYIQNILLEEVDRFASRSDRAEGAGITLVSRRAFNSNGTQRWFNAIVALLDQLSMLVIVLTGAALIREREHGTIEHLLVMPLSAFQIVMAKVWANCLIILVAFMLSVTFIVEGLLDVPIAGSRGLLLLGTIIYLFSAAAIGIFLGTIARTMAQFGLLMLMTFIPIKMLSGGMSPIESQPDIIQPFTWILPSRHFMSFAQAVVFRGADLEIVWPQILTVAGLGFCFFALSFALFRRSIESGK